MRERERGVFEDANVYEDDEDEMKKMREGLLFLLVCEDKNPLAFFFRSRGRRESISSLLSRIGRIGLHMDFDFKPHSNSQYLESDYRIRTYTIQNQLHHRIRF